MPGSSRKTTKERQAEAERQLQVGLSLSEQSGEIGTSIINSLEQQKEKQLASTDNVEATDYMLQQSMRTLRGMTWSGWVYNMFSGEGKLKPASTTIKNRSREMQANSDNSQPDIPEEKQNALRKEIGVNRYKQQDDEVEKLSSSLSRLQNISSSIGEALVENDEITDSLTNKISDTNDYALAVTLRTAQMSQRSTGSKACLLGEYKFKTLHNNYLSVFDESITLTPQFNRSTVFRVYVKENHLYAMQNAKTLKFLGLNLWGSVVVTSTGFGKNQEMFIDLDGKMTGILFLASNWGGGGWLKPDKDGLLRAVTSSLTDREDRLLITPTPLTEADYKKLKNM